MRSRILAVAVAAVFLLVVSGCMAHTHRVGEGGQTGYTQSGRQWYFLYGLVPLNNVDTNVIAGRSTDYKIDTSYSVLDFIINLFTGWRTIYSRTVTVTK